MKKMLSMVVLIAITFYGYSQKLPADKPTENKSLKTADLAITEIKLLEANRTEQTLLHTIKIVVTIRNNGQSSSGSTLIRMMVQNAGAASVATQGPPTNPWYELGGANTMSPIAAGQSFTGEYVFTENKKVTKGNSFAMRVIADAGNVLAEANENDNFSVPITVNPVSVAGELVALPPTVQVSSQLKKIDTLVYTIGTSDFRLSNFAGMNGQIKIYPHGLAVEAPGGSPIYNSLVAPLHLPPGSVIRAVRFNYINLNGTRSIPHLGLMIRGVDGANGGYISRKNITSTWSNSRAISGRTGFDVQYSITSPGFNYPFKGGVENYFEILVDDNAEAILPNPGVSTFPNNDRLFIWSINVYYILN